MAGTRPYLAQVGQSFSLDQVDAAEADFGGLTAEVVHAESWNSTSGRRIV